jgi:hypothetical protein
MRNYQNAFPVTYGNDGVEHGMTLRDYFAAKAMQSYINLGSLDATNFNYKAKKAYQMADAMLVEREQS